MAGDEVIVDVGGVRGGVAQAFQAVDLGQPAQQIGQVALFAGGVFAVIGVDVLAEQVDFKRAGFYQPARFFQHVFHRPRSFHPAGIGNDAVGAEVVAAFLDGKIGAGAFGTVFRQMVEFAFGGKLGVDDAEVLVAGDFLQNFGNPVIGEGAGGKIDERRPSGDFSVFRLNHAADDADDGFQPGGLAFFFNQINAAEVGKKLFRRFFPDVAGVEDDQAGLGGGSRRGVSHVLQNAGNALRIVNVHLAAEGFDVVFHFCLLVPLIVFCPHISLKRGVFQMFFARCFFCNFVIFCRAEKDFCCHCVLSLLSCG